MSGNTEEEKHDTGKLMPLDLARNQTKGVETTAKGPIVIPGQHLRNMRVLTQTVASGTATTPTIITTNILPSAVLKQGKLVNIDLQQIIFLLLQTQLVQQKHLQQHRHRCLVVLRFKGLHKSHWRQRGMSLHRMYHQGLHIMCQGDLLLLLIWQHLGVM